MEEDTSALLVHDEAEPLGALQEALEGLSVRTYRARSCREVMRLLEQPTSPHLVFTAGTLPDGTWADVLRLAATAPVPVNVIVVRRIADVRFYVEVIESGAFDFISPPFVGSDFAYVVRCAAENVLSRRKVRGHAA